MNEKPIVIIVLAILTFLFMLIPTIRLWVLFALWCALVLFSIKKITNRITLLVFHLTIFIFLLSQLILPYFVNNEYIQFRSTEIINFRPATYQFIYSVIFIALIMSFAGFSCINASQHKHKKESSGKERYYRRIRSAAKMLIWISIGFYCIEILEKVIFVWHNGYLSYYSSFVKSLPSIIYKIASIFQLSFFLYMATLPSKGEAKKFIFIYLLIGFLSLLIGGRSEFMLAIIFIIVYMFLRNYIDNKQSWITRKGIILVIMFVPIICAAMFLVMIIRGGGEMSGTFGIIDLAINLLFQQGNSFQIIGLSYEMENSFPEGQYYSMGPLINNFNDNFIFHLIGISHSYVPQTVEMAMCGHSLGSYLTYIIDPSRYLAGGGFGSSYIAEAWLDGGYFGVLFWSFTYGVVLAKIYCWIKSNVWLSCLSFYMLVNIVFAPRGHVISFISEFISPTYFLVMIIVYLYAKHPCRLKERYENYHSC